MRDEARRQEATAQSRMCTLPLWAIARVAEAFGVVALEGVARAALQAVAETRAASSEARARMEAQKQMRVLQILPMIEGSLTMQFAVPSLLVTVGEFQ